VDSAEGLEVGSYDGCALDVLGIKVITIDGLRSLGLSLGLFDGSCVDKLRVLLGAIDVSVDGTNDIVLSTSGTLGSKPGLTDGYALSVGCSDILGEPLCLALGLFDGCVEKLGVLLGAIDGLVDVTNDILGGTLDSKLGVED
jgi:hypothetical protein